VVAVLTDRAHSAELTVFLGAVELQVVLGMDRRELLRTLSDPSELAGWMNVWIQRFPPLSLLATIEGVNQSVWSSSSAICTFRPILALKSKRIL
jgi:hypothetical protein